MTRIWGVRLATLLAVFAGWNIFIPGVDALALQALKASGGATNAAIAESCSLFSVALWPLLVVSIGLSMFGGVEPLVVARRERIGVVAYLLWCALAAYTQAQELVASGRTFASFEPVLVPDPSRGFLATAVLTWVAGGAVLWFLAQWVTKHGAMLGVVLITGAVVVAQDVALLKRGWHMASAGEVPLAPLAHALPWMLSLLALWWAKPAAWPVQAPLHFVLRSRWEVVLLPLAVGRAAGTAGLVSVPISIAAALVGWSALNKANPSRGSPVFLAAALMALAPGLALVAWPVGERVLEARTPGPYAGGGNFEVELTCANASAEVTAHDAEILERRLARVRVKSTVRADGPGRLRLTLAQLGSAQDLLADLTPRYRLRFQLVARDQALLSPRELDWQAAGLEVESDYDGRAITGPTEESLRPLLDGVEVPAGYEVGVECRERPEGTRCHAKLLETEGALEGRTIREASVGRDSQGQPNVFIEFNDEGTAQLSRLSSELGRQLAIVLDGKILSSPTIQSRIDEGRASISMGRTAGRDRFRAAQRLADGLQTSPLECEWQTASLRASP